MKRALVPHINEMSAHGGCTWRVYNAHGGCTWRVHMEGAHGGCTWRVHMEGAHGRTTYWIERTFPDDIEEILYVAVYNENDVYGGDGDSDGEE